MRPAHRAKASTLMIRASSYTIVNEDEDKLIIQLKEDDPEVITFRLKDREFWINREDSDRVINVIKLLAGEG